MDLRHVLESGLAVVLCLLGAGCGSATVPDRTPRETTVSVRYVRALPVTDPLAAEIVTLRWYFPEQSGGTDMTKISDQAWEAHEVLIRTETVVSMDVFDLRIGAWVSKYLVVNGQDVSSSVGYDATRFILGNDGKIRKLD